LGILYLGEIQPAYAWQLISKISQRITGKIFPFVEVREEHVPGRHVEIVGFKEPCVGG
jgi:hypothetical protein